MKNAIRFYGVNQLNRIHYTDLENIIMRKKYFLLLGLSFSILLNVYLINDIKYKIPECEKIHTDDIDKSKNVIPTEKAAIKIAKLSIILDENLEYDIETNFNEVFNEWYVYFNPRNKDVLDGGWRVRISKSYGIINKVWR